MNFMKQSKQSIMSQFFVITFLIAIFWNLALMSKYTEKSNILVIIVGTIFINSLLGLCIYKLFFEYTFHFNLKSFLYKRRYLFLLYLIFIVCFCTILDSWLNLDGYTYYTFLREMKSWDFANLRTFMLAGHTSQGYTMLLMIGEFLFPNNVIGVRLIHCIMALITIDCFYQIINKTIQDSDIIQRTLYTAIFAFAPIFLGLLGEINTDFPLLCFFTWMICCSVKEKYLLQTFCGIMLCFSKETGCFLYGFYIIGIVLCRFIQEIQTGEKNIILITKSIFSYDILLMMLGGILWITNHILVSDAGWSETLKVSNDSATNGYRLNSFGIYPQYILSKLLQMIYINFNWVLYGIILIMVCLSVILGKKFFSKKVNIKTEILIGIFASFISFIIYNFVYITYNHYRYLMPFAFFISFGVAISINRLFMKEKLKKGISILLVTLLLISNFFTFDPISKALFMCQGTGTGDILIPSTVAKDANGYAVLNSNSDYSATIINTSSAYNFQFAYLGKCYDKTLMELHYNENILIILPCQYRDKYGTIASIFGLNLRDINDYYWDTEKNHLNINCANDIEIMKGNTRYQKLNLEIVNNMSDIGKNVLKEYKEIYYIELPFMKEFDHNKFLGKYPILNTKEVQYINWKWKVDKLK